MLLVFAPNFVLPETRVVSKSPTSLHLNLNLKLLIPQPKNQSLKEVILRTSTL
jgi:hypothetical protein